MNPPNPVLSRAARVLAFGSAALIVVSIAASQILLGLALATLLLSGEKLRLPPIKWPLFIFVAGTIVAWLCSGNIGPGLPQIRKFFVFAELLTVFSLLRTQRLVRALFLTWAGLATFTAALGFLQFGQRVRQAHELGLNFYDYYVAQRITGFTNHWNTFSAEEMYALIMLAAFLFFGVKTRRSWIWLACASLISIAVILIETRGIWIALAAAVVYLVWFWRRRLVLALPVAAAIAFLIAPPAIRERFESVLQPKQVDSNAFRKVVWRTGIQMIERHPWLGLGPEGQRVHFDEYMPKDILVKPVGFYGHLHNLYIEYAAERGVPVLLVFLWLIGQIIFDFSRGVRQLPPGRSNRRFLLHGAIAAVIATLVEGFVEVNLGDSEVLIMFLVIVACGYLALEKDLAFD